MKFISYSYSFLSYFPFYKGNLLLIGLFFISNISLGQVEQKIEFFKNPLLEEAQNLHEERKYKEAEALVDQGLERFQKEKDYSNFSEALMLKAKVAMHQHRIDESIMWYDSSANFSKSKNLNYHSASALNAQGDILNYKNQNDLAISKSRAVLKIPNQPSVVYSAGYANLSEAYLSKGLLDSCDKYTVLVFENDSIHNNVERFASNYLALGKMYARKGNNEKAISFYLKGLEYISDKREVLKCGAFLRLSSAFFQINNLQKAKEYATRAKGIAEKYNLKTGKSRGILKLATIAEINGDFQSAIDLYTEALAHFKKAKNPKDAVETYLGLTKCYLELDRIEDAQTALEAVQTNVEESDNDQHKLKYFVVESLFNLKTKDFPATLTMLSKADEKAKSLKNIFRQRDVFKIYSDYYTETEQMKLAFDNLQNYHAMKDSISQIQQAYIIHDLDGKYQKAEQDLKIQKLDAETILMNQKLARRNWAIGIGGFILLLISMLSFVIFNLYQKNKEKTVELFDKNNQLGKTLNEKSFLLKEIHHRVKNNLQIVSSLLALQARNVQDKVALDALKEGQSRVRSMALIHQNLYQDDDLIGVEAKAYIEKLSTGLFQSYNIDQERIKLHTDIKDLKLDVDTIIPLGLIINELITNALKYAFEKDTKGNIHVALNEQEGNLVFSLKDDGIGLPADFNVDKNKSLGYRLIRAFSQKLEAVLLVEGTHGTKITLTIPNS